jgi:isomerase DpgB
MEIYRVVNELGLAQARRLVIGTRELTADRALSCGLVDALVEDLTPAAEAAAAELCDRARRDHAIRRSLMHEATASSYEEALGVHLAACDRELRRRAAAHARGDAETAKPDDGAT